jgi:uncharacterized membrane-anchored protein YitT (DUF2179 family)
VGHKVCNQRIERVFPAEHKAGAVINKAIEEPVTYLKESNPKDPEPHGILLAVITRFEEQKIKAAIYSVDPSAFVVISNAHEVIGESAKYASLSD